MSFKIDCIENHEYAEKTCVKCGHVFCFSCCGNTNVHEGGKYQPDFMECPKCGHDYYSNYLIHILDNAEKEIK